MSNLVRVLQALYCDPWCIRPEFHAKLCDIVNQHAAGLAHEAEGCAARMESAGAAKAPFDGAYTMSAVRPLSVAAGGQEVKTQQIAVIPINGVIGRKYSNCLNSSGVVSIDILEKIIETLTADAKIDAIVMDIESPGGHSLGVGDTADAISRATQRKPVLAYAGGLMASAAYWLAAPSDAIVVGRTAAVGSIGVYSLFLDTKRMYENAGVVVELIKAGRFKGMGVEGTSLNDEQREYIQGRVNKGYAEFTAAVRASRGRELSSELMQGQIFDGDEAVANGLADQIGTLGDAIALAAKMARER